MRMTAILWGQCAVGSEVTLSFKSSLCLPHHSWLMSFLPRASPEAHLLLPQGPLLFRQPFIPLQTLT